MISNSTSAELNVAIIGGGPGGLFSAHLLEKKTRASLHVTLFEASDRLGGKLQTKTFSVAPVKYEAGAAELYDYSTLGADPLREMVRQFGLSVRQISGETVVLDGTILNNAAAIKSVFGATTANAVHDFRERCVQALTPDDYYDSPWQQDNLHPWASRTLQSVLAEIPDERARRYIWAAAHSDVATEPYLCNALNGLKNFLMDDERYLQQYVIDGGLEGLCNAVAEELTVEKRVASPVVSVRQRHDGLWEVTSRNGTDLQANSNTDLHTNARANSLTNAHANSHSNLLTNAHSNLHSNAHANSRTNLHTNLHTETFDVVIVALPVNLLRTIEWGGSLAPIIERHCSRYDAPGHYLRISVLFNKAFWRNTISESYFMLDAFGGCCVYAETNTTDDHEFGVLGWLLAGQHALAMAELSDEELFRRALASLPAPLDIAHEYFMEGRVHRWIAAIAAQPGGYPVQELSSRHVPDAIGHPGLFVVGDYLFDATVNGVLDSADMATDLVISHFARKQLAQRAANRTVPLTTDYHDTYADDASYEDSFEEYFDAEYTCDLIREVWGAEVPFRLLDCGSASGLTLQAFADEGVDAWGIENSAYIHARTPPELLQRNLLGDVRQLPFPDNHFDFVYETCLCYVSESDLPQAISELFRVTRRGLIFGSITTDMMPEIIEKHDLLYDVQTLNSLSEWSARFQQAGFLQAVRDQATLKRAWEIETDANEGEGPWYASAESLRLCFYTKPNALVDSFRGEAGNADAASAHQERSGAALHHHR